MTITYEWRGVFNSAEVGALHAHGFGHGHGFRQGRATDDWWTRVNRHSLGWVCARRDGGLVGFVNVAWDGSAHAFVLDTVVADSVRRRGVGTRLVRAAAEGARAAGCEWLHVDFEVNLQTFYVDACGFVPTAAGLVAL
jgi:GNAT superfamily N-acetyltransferase